MALTSGACLVVVLVRVLGSDRPQPKHFEDEDEDEDEDEGVLESPKRPHVRRR